METKKLPKISLSGGNKSYKLKINEADLSNYVSRLELEVSPESSVAVLYIPFSEIEIPETILTEIRAYIEKDDHDSKT